MTCDFDGIFVILTVALDFGLTYARRGELLDYIKRLGCFDENCTRFYVAEVTEALEYLHSIGIIHRYDMSTFVAYCLIGMLNSVFSCNRSLTVQKRILTEARSIPVDAHRAMSTESATRNRKRRLT